MSFCSSNRHAPALLSYPLNRKDVRNWLSKQIDSNIRSLIGIDCNLGFSQDIGKAISGPEYDNYDVWNKIEECCVDLEDYFASGFWNNEKYKKYFWVQGEMPENFRKYSVRLTEKLCREKGMGNPENPLKLIGPKQVGKGGLAGMRMLLDLKKEYGKNICIWPFEKYYDEAKVVIAEIYPRLFLKAAGASPSKVTNLEELNRILSFYKSDPFTPDEKITNHMTDAIISCAALRFYAGTSKEIPEYLARPSHMTDIVASKEGWIWGV